MDYVDNEASEAPAQAPPPPAPEPVEAPAETPPVEARLRSFEDEILDGVDDLFVKGALAADFSGDIPRLWTVASEDAGRFLDRLPSCPSDDDLRARIEEHASEGEALAQEVADEVQEVRDLMVLMDESAKPATAKTARWQPPSRVAKRARLRMADMGFDPAALSFDQLDLMPAQKPQQQAPELFDPGKMNYEQLNSMNAQFIWRAEPDACVRCGGYDGQTFTWRTAPVLPGKVHRACRCTADAVVEGKRSRVAARAGVRLRREAGEFQSKPTGSVDDVGTRIHDKRTKSDKSVREVGQEADVAYGYVSDIEHGKANPTIEEVEKIERVLGSRNVGGNSSIPALLREADLSESLGPSGPSESLVIEDPSAHAPTQVGVSSGQQQRQRERSERARQEREQREKPLQWAGNLRVLLTRLKSVVNATDPSIAGQFDLDKLSDAYLTISRAVKPELWDELDKQERNLAADEELHSVHESKKKEAFTDPKALADQLSDLEFRLGKLIEQVPEGVSVDVAALQKGLEMIKGGAQAPAGVTAARPRRMCRSCGGTGGSMKSVCPRCEGLGHLPRTHRKPRMARQLSETELQADISRLEREIHEQEAGEASGLREPAPEFLDYLRETLNRQMGFLEQRRAAPTMASVHTAADDEEDDEDDSEEHGDDNMFEDDADIEVAPEEIDVVPEFEVPIEEISIEEEGAQPPAVFESGEEPLMMMSAPLPEEDLFGGLVEEPTAPSLNLSDLKDLLPAADREKLLEDRIDHHVEEREELEKLLEDRAERAHELVKKLVGEAKLAAKPTTSVEELEASMRRPRKNGMPPKRDARQLYEPINYAGGPEFAFWEA